MERVIDGIDHVVAPIVGAAAVFRVLTDDLGLPAAWPFADHGGIASGGVCLGNANLEISESGTMHPWFRAQSPARIQGLVFTPARPIDEAFAATIRARGIGCSRPMPHEGELLGASGLVWTNLWLEGLIGDDAGAMLCEYHVPAAVDLKQRQAKLDAAGGGRLGAMGVAEVVIGSPDPEAARARWARLLDPAPCDDRGWTLRHGPRLRVAAGDAEQVEALVLAVRAPRAARAEFERVAPGLAGLSFVFTQA